VCPAGEEVQKAEDGTLLDCSSGKTDRHCQPCPAGKYRSIAISSTTDVCLACSACDGTLLEECTAISDTVCDDGAAVAAEALTQRIQPEEGKDAVVSSAKRNAVQDNVQSEDITEDEEMEEDELSKQLAAKMAAKKDAAKSD